MILLISSPTPSIDWRRTDGAPLHNNRTSVYLNELEVRGLKPSDGGEYECVGRNVVGQNSDTTTLRVHSKYLTVLLLSISQRVKW